MSGLLNAGDGTLLASFIAGGAVQLRPDGRILTRTRKEDPKTGSMRLARTPDGEIWLGGTSLGRLTRSGTLLKLEDHPLQTTPAGNVLAIKYENHTRKLWACYNGGLVVRDEHRNWKEFTARDGLLGNGCWSLAPLPNGDVWYAYYGLRALALIRPGAGENIAVRHYGPESGIPEPGSDTMDADPGGRLWRG